MIDYALDYDNKVLNDKIITDKDVKRACKLDLLNRRKSKSSKYPYYYDRKVADRFVKLAMLLSPKKLADFQLAFISIINGWRFKNNPKIRRYQEALYTMARKNAKSYEAALILCSSLLTDEIEGKVNQQAYILAVNLNQSLLTLQQCKDMINRLQQSSDLARNFKITKTKIYSTVTGSKIEAVSSRPGALNGCNPKIVDIDEVEAMHDDKLIQVMKSAMALQPNGLILMTSTAGFIDSPVKTEWKTCEAALKNNDVTSRLFGFIYTMDSREEIYKDHSTWCKSNPLMTLPSVKQVMKPYLENQLKSALVMNTTNSTITKNFNMFGTTNDNNFIEPDKWTTNEIKPVSLTNRNNVVLGLDLSKTHDLSSLSITFPLDNGKYYTDVHAWVAEDSKGIEVKSKADKVNYLKLEQEGLVTVCRSNFGLIDYKSIEKYILNLINKYHLANDNVYLAFDPWGSSTVVQDLSENLNLVRVSQSPRNLSETIRTLYRLIVSHKLLHRKNALYDYAFRNVSTSYNSHGTLYLDKRRNAEKIDPVFSLIDSLFVQQSLKKRNKKSFLKQELDKGNFIF